MKKKNFSPALDGEVEQPCYKLVLSMSFNETQ